jgi:hypothetical protein
VLDFQYFENVAVGFGEVSASQGTV